MRTAWSLNFSLIPRRQLFHIGYNVDTEQLDASYYDLLSSEARIASLVAIAKGDVPSAPLAASGQAYGTC